MRTLIAERLNTRYWDAADAVLIKGSTPWEIDEAMVAFGFAHGPYETQDLLGLDTAYDCRLRQEARQGKSYRTAPIMERMLDLGKLGKKAGAGWYRYPGGGGKVEDPIVADLAIEEAYFAKITRIEYTQEQIRKRLVLGIINEAANILHEGADAHDIDQTAIQKCGFPSSKGGPLFYADTLGAKAIAAALNELAQDGATPWPPAPLFMQCAKTGASITSGRTF